MLETIVRKRLPHRKWGYQEWSWFIFVTGGSGSHLGEEADKTAVEELKLPSFGKKLVVEERVKSKDPPANESAGKGDGAEELIPFIVGESLPVVPAKLVKKILRGGFCGHGRPAEGQLGGREMPVLPGAGQGPRILRADSLL